MDKKTFKSISRRNKKTRWPGYIELTTQFAYMAKYESEDNASRQFKFVSIMNKLCYHIQSLGSVTQFEHYEFSHYRYSPDKCMHFNYDHSKPFKDIVKCATEDDF